MMKTESPKTLAMELTERVKNVSANLPPEKLKIMGRMIEEFKGSGVESPSLKGPASFDGHSLTLTTRSGQSLPRS